MKRGRRPGPDYTPVLSAGSDGWIVATCPEVPGAITQGRTFDEARDNLADAVRGIRAAEVDADRRLNLMDEVDELRYSAWDRISSPKNVTKGGWDGIPTWRLFAMLLEEALELAWEVLRRRRDRTLHEGGDLLVVAAMLTERTRRG